KERVHVLPRQADVWKTAANPENSYTALLKESADFVRFVNPGDLRVADQTCGARSCHPTEVARVRQSMMTHGAMLWGAALYNNGAFPLKDAHFGESYAPDGSPQRLQTIPQPALEATRVQGVLPALMPLPRFEVTQPGNVLRVFERGDDRLSFRGYGTLTRTDPVFQGLQRTRLLDPALSLLGTNDHPGDYRSSGCSACHVVYANDRDRFHSGPYARAGNLGTSATVDPTIPHGERGHPIRHAFTRAIPSSQCVVCHMHPGTGFANSYFGYTWWDNETHGEFMYPRHQRRATPEQELACLSKNPEASAVRGLWSDLDPDAVSQIGERAGPDFLARTSELNPRLWLTKFADFHGHGWMFRAVFKHDRKGNLLDAIGRVVDPVTPENTQIALETAVEDRPHGGAGIPVHLKDIHLEKGMHCIDCHFEQDVHGNGKLYGELRNAIEIECVDCHGSVRGLATLITSGPAAPPGGTDLSTRRTPFGTPVFRRESDRLVQRSMVDPNLSWEVVQVIDTITPGSRHYSARSRLAKTLRRDGTTWGDAPRSADALAHPDDDMACYACHTSWMTSCFGCHLPMRANQRRPMLHNEGELTRNWTQYNYQVLRDDVFMLGRDGTVKNHRIAPVRSSSAVLVSSQNQNREWIYSQQQTVSAEGYSGQTFNTHVPHTVRATETKTCTDCHVSKTNDNNAWMAQVLLQGTNFVKFMGRYVYVAANDSLEAVVATERSEPQAVIGSTLQKIAYPRNYQKFLSGGRELREAYEHKGNPRVLGVQLRGEYAYVAAGEGGLRVYDVAQIDQKGFSERITTAPVSRFGQKLWVKTRYATAVTAPSTLAVDPARWRMTADGKMVSPDEARKLPREQLLNEEQPIHPLYAYLYVVDKYEGLIVVNAATLLDGDPLNNYLKRQLDESKYPNSAFNPDGVLSGANNITIAGTNAYITTGRELVVVSLDDPLNPKIVNRISFNHTRSIAIQFRYGLVVDDDGLKVIEVTTPQTAQMITGATVPLRDARDVYVARTYAYVADGKDGVAIIDVKQPDKPRLDQIYNAEGKVNDTRQVKIAMTNASLFAYVADGKNGLRVLQLTSPETMPTYAGFSPRPAPQLIASFKTRGDALAVSKPLDRDRAVDESGNQIAVFGRRGARPFNLAEMQRMLRVNEGRGDFFTVSDEPSSAPRSFAGTSGINSGVLTNLLLGVLLSVTGYCGAKRLKRRAR